MSTAATPTPPPGTQPSPGRRSHAESAHRGGMAALTLGALGVVFGDIGTSPLYALRAVFSADNHAVRPTHAGIYGIISLVFWSVTIIVSIKYVTLIMRADNDGEGGIMALIAKVREAALAGRAKWVLVGLGLFGASLFYGDGMITPAISVLSAVEGLEVSSPGLADLVVPITVAIIVVLFAIQRFGTGAVGRAFGPVMGIWFAVLAVAGLGHVVSEPGILRALSPSYGIAFFADDPKIAFISLGSVVLTVTGAEALYADMGHFGRSPIRRAWFAAVFPALILNYMGQGALILGDHKAIDNPFFLLFPSWARFPMVLLATVATVIASQAVISGAFSVTRQAVGLGFLPRLRIRHTSAQEAGQVYVPAINWGLFAAVVALVVGFGSSQRLASAYGIAVTGTLAIDTLLFFVVVRLLWRKPLWLAIAGAVAFLIVDLAFLSANVTKILHGGWFPLIVAACVFTVFTTWQRGREIVTAKRTEAEGPLEDFIRDLHELRPPVDRAPGCAVFLSANRETTPLALRANLEHNHTVHRHMVIVSVQMAGVPHVPLDDRLTVDDLGYQDDGITHVTARFGFQDRTDVPAQLERARDALEGDVDLERASYFLSKMTIVPGRSAGGLARWRMKLFLALARNAANPVEYFELPDERTVVMGTHIEL
jgi:KUP system potassium uptake protein